jgi:hypothetical protein
VGTRSDAVALAMSAKRGRAPGSEIMAGSHIVKSGYFSSVLEFFTKRLARFLTKPTHAHSIPYTVDAAALMRTLSPGDVLLVEGFSRVSTAIKYLTQSTWSHAAIFVGDVFGKADPAGHPLCVIEVDVVEGVRAVSLESFHGLHCRICRPVGLGIGDSGKLTDFLTARIGYRYDLKNVFDLCRYLIPTPPVFSSWRRRMIALGSGFPTRAICSTLIALAFESIRYPILPVITNEAAPTIDCPDCLAEMLHVRHHSLYVPRDFDVSPYFEVVKPTLSAGFDFHSLRWAA